MDVSGKDAKVCVRIQGSAGRPIGQKVTAWGPMTYQTLAMRDT